MIFRIKGEKDDVRTISLELDDGDVNLKVDGGIILWIDEHGFVHIADSFAMAKPVLNPVGKIK